MKNIQEFLYPLIITNLIALLFLILAFISVKACKILFSILFTGASFFNIYTALTNPEAYLEMGKYSLLEIYKVFIYSVFTDYTTLFILLISIGQIFIGIGILFTGNILKLSIYGGIIFLVCIAPLGIGSAFPSTLIMAISFIIIFRKTFYKDEPMKDIELLRKNLSVS